MQTSFTLEIVASHFQFEASGGGSGGADELRTHGASCSTSCSFGCDGHYLTCCVCVCVAFTSNSTGQTRSPVRRRSHIRSWACVANYFAVAIAIAAVVIFFFLKRLSFVICIDASNNSRATFITRQREIELANERRLSKRANKRTFFARQANLF